MNKFVILLMVIIIVVLAIAFAFTLIDVANNTEMTMSQITGFLIH